MREFRLFFGGSTVATAAVMAVFMGGLGLGSLVLGKRADLKAHPLRYYAKLETLIAGFTALTPLLFVIAGWLYVFIGGIDNWGNFLTGIVRIVLAAMVVGLPAFLMGGTLPAAARAAESNDDPARRRMAVLYGANTLGAVTGAVLSTFWLIELAGQRGALWIACAVNLMAALAAFLLSWETGKTADRPETSRPATSAAAPLPLVLGAAAATGFVFFLMELVWYRMLTPLLGGTTFTFGLILGAALAGVGVGGAAYGLRRTAQPATLSLFALTCLMEAFFIGLPLWLGDRLSILAQLLRPLGALGFSGQIGGWLVITMITVFPAAFMAGFQFPLLIALLGKGRKDIGRHTGLAYAFNTAGAIIGSLGGGFGLLPALTAPGAWRLCVILLLGFGLAAWICAWVWMRPRPKVVVPLIGTLAVFMVLAAPGPTGAWRYSPIGAGRVHLPIQPGPNDLRSWQQDTRRGVLWEADGVESSVAIVAQEALAFVVNGKVDGNSRTDAGMQVMNGMVAALLHPDPKSALVIGLGTGSTAGWLGAIPSLERVDVAELEPVILEVARQCAPVNRKVLENPKVHFLIGDARETLMTTRRQYDLICSEPSNPYRSGVASLFTREFYQSVAQKLRPGGIFVQWVQAYEIDARTFKSIVSTLRSVFPELEVWEATETDLIFLASRDPIPHDLSQLRRKIAEEPYRSALSSAWRASDAEGFLARYVGGTELARQVASDPTQSLNTDDRNLLEFSFARNLGVQKPGGFSINLVRQAAREAKAGRPAVNGGDLDWQKVTDRQIAMATTFGFTSVLEDSLDEGQRNRLAAFRKYAGGSPEEALRLWKAGGREPEDVAEWEAVAELLADDSDEAALPLIEKVRSFQPTAASLIEARLFWRQGKTEDAVRSLVIGLQGCKEDPWVQPAMLIRSLSLLEEIVASDPAKYAKSLRTVVEKPFAVHLGDERRLRTLVRVSQYADTVEDNGFTLAALRLYEPHVPWNGDFLQLREKVYSANGDPEAERAKRELESYRRAAASTTILPPGK